MLLEEEAVLTRPHRVPLTLDVSGPLRVTLSWTDAPGQPLPGRTPDLLNNPTPHLVRDLDLRLIHLSSGVAYRPYVLDPTAPHLAATWGDNRVDPIEQIYVSEAPAGRYAAEVSMKNAPGSPVAFTLLIAGARDEAAPVTVDSASAEIRGDVVHLRWTAMRERFAGTYVIERATIGTSDLGAALEAVYEPVAHIPTAAETSPPGGTGRPYTYTEPIDASGPRLYRVYFVAPRSNTRILLASLRLDIPTPERLAVVSAYPNPFRGQATAILNVPETRDMVVDLIDVLGRRRLLLVDAPLHAGRHVVAIDADGLPAGLYYIRLMGEGATATRSIIHMPGH